MTETYTLECDSCNYAQDDDHNTLEEAALAWVVVDNGWVDNLTTPLGWVRCEKCAPRCLSCEDDPDERCRDCTDDHNWDLGIR